MNTERLLQVAAYIEKLPPYDGTQTVDDPPSFYMDKYRHPCGAPGCIAAHVLDLFNVPCKERYRTGERAAEALDLPHGLASSLLFEPQGLSIFYTCVTPAQAAAALRNVAAGERMLSKVWPGLVDKDECEEQAADEVSP